MNTPATKGRNQKLSFLGKSTFKHLVENSSDVIALIDNKANIFYASPSVKKIFGYSSKNFVGKNGLTYLHPEDLPVILKSLREISDNKVKNTLVQARIRHKDGHWVWIEAIGQNLIDDEDIGALVVNFRDISERKELERRKDEFIGIASHELKTPIATIKSYSQILEKFIKEGRNELLLTYIIKMEFQINRLVWLVDGLLDVSSIQSGKLKLKKTRCDLDKLIEEVIEEIQPLDYNHQLIFRKKANKKIMLDKNRINQVLTNFINNAIKYSPKANKVIIEAGSSGNEAMVSVKDYGIGITRTNQQKVFERFYQVDNKIRESFSGLGLGLYISSEIIKKHGGVISVRSIKGKGSTFKFTLPLKR